MQVGFLQTTDWGVARIRGFKILLDGKPLLYDQRHLVIANALGLGINGASVDYRSMRIGILIKPDFSDYLF